MLTYLHNCLLFLLDWHFHECMYVCIKMHTIITIITIITYFFFY